MALRREKIVMEDLELGTGTVTRTTDSGGTIVGTKISLSSIDSRIVMAEDGAVRIPERLAVGTQAASSGTIFLAYKNLTSGAGQPIVEFDLDDQSTVATDCGAMRAVANAYNVNSNIRAGEFHSSLRATSTSGVAYGVELSVSNGISGGSVTGLLITCIGSGWISAPWYRAGSAIYITGTEGWNYGIQYRDNDNVTVLFSVDQYGAGIFKSTVTTPTVVANGTTLTLDTTSHANDVVIGSAYITAKAGGNILIPLAATFGGSSAPSGVVDIYASADNTTPFRVRRSNATAIITGVVAAGGEGNLNVLSAAGVAKIFLNAGGESVFSLGVNIVGDFNHDGTNVGFFGTTPAARTTAYTQTYSTADRTHAAPTSTALTDNSGGAATSTLAAITGGGAGCENAVKNAIASLSAKVNALIVDLADTKQLCNSMIDDLQLYGLFQ